MSVDIVCPEGSDIPHNVVPDGSGSGPLGHICAHGDATLDSRASPVAQKHRATMVHAKIFASFDPNAAENQQPPLDATLIPTDIQGMWRHESIPGARHDSSAPPMNILVIWAVFGTGAAIIRTRNFPGITANVISCCEGSGSGRALQRQGQAGVALVTAPLLWALLAAGFEAAHAAFNGAWALALRGSSDGTCVWDNAGDGSRTPHVQLRCESPLAITWCLTLRNGKGSAVEYVRPAAEWNPLGANVLRRSDDEAVPGTPDILTVTPG